MTMRWVPLGLRGDHQVPERAGPSNWLTEECNGFIPVVPPNFDLRPAVRDVQMAGRLQIDPRRPAGAACCSMRAHNPRRRSPVTSPKRRVSGSRCSMVFGAMRDKDVALMVRNLLPAVSTMVMTEPAQRGHSAAESEADGCAKGVTNARNRGRARISPRALSARGGSARCVRGGIDLSRRQYSAACRASHAISRVASSPFAGYSSNGLLFFFQSA